MNPRHFSIPPALAQQPLKADAKTTPIPNPNSNSCAIGET
jgi:hypothetical protein